MTSIVDSISHHQYFHSIKIRALQRQQDRDPVRSDFIGLQERRHGNTADERLNWQIGQWPQLALEFDDTKYNQGALSTRVFRDANETLKFDKGENFPIYDGNLHTKEEFEYRLEGVQTVYTQKQLDGSSFEYIGLTGMFVGFTDKYGNRAQVLERAENGFNVSKVQVGSDLYEYQYSEKLLYKVWLKRYLPDGTLINVAQCEYTYVASQIITATTRIWEYGNWVTSGTSFYRYWPDFDLSSSSSSSLASSSGPNTPKPFLIKYALEPGSFERLSQHPGVVDPVTAPDAIVALYADYYFEYDDNRRVVREMIRGGSQTFEFAYEESGFSDDYNHWHTKTTETLPDGNQNIVYSNFAGQTILKVLWDGINEWSEYTNYDDRGRAILFANPSAVDGFNEGTPELVTLKDDEGLIRTVTYHEPSGYVSSESLQKGQSGPSILLRELEYCCAGQDCGCSENSFSSSSSSSSSGGGEDCGSGVWFVSKETVYPDETDPSHKLVTTYCRSFYDGVWGVKEQITTLPAVPTDQNGTGISATRREFYDANGYLTWTMDERGFVNRTAFDFPTGAIAQHVADADTSLYDDVPDGWVTRPGGGKNLVTDIENDQLGRPTQTLEPVYTGVVESSATVLRTASWNAYYDDSHVTISSNGYWTEDGSILVNPVSITKTDAGGRVDETLQAVSSETEGTLQDILAEYAADDRCGTDPTFGTPPLCGFPQTSYCRWTTYQYTDCCLMASKRVYHNIPDSGEGSVNTNFDETEFGYDLMKRLVRTVSPGGTITDLVREIRGLVVSAWIGTNDDGGTLVDPSGGGTHPDNNMVEVVSIEYDYGVDMGDGNVTQLIKHVDASTRRVTSMLYDFRNRRTVIDGEIDFYQVDYFDNLDRITKTERYDTYGPDFGGGGGTMSSSSSSGSSLGNLIARNEVLYDDRNRIYRTIRYAVEPSTGQVGNALTDDFWFDDAGNQQISMLAGSSLYTHTDFDSLNRPTLIYTAFGEKVVIEQQEIEYDTASHVIQTTVRKRYHNAPASQGGLLQDPSTAPKARVTYRAAWVDGVGRTIATAEFGTNGGTTLSRPSNVPSRSDTVLVTSRTFDDTGLQQTAIDPAGTTTYVAYDAAARRVTFIENYLDFTSSSSTSSGDDCEPSDDMNRTTQFTYTADGMQASMNVLNLRTGDQTTIWTYGTTLDDSDIATSVQLRSVTYPDSVDENDVVKLTYNRQAERTTLTDQRGCVHSYDFDLLGRQTHDRVTTVGKGVDDAVLRISAEFEVRGMLTKLTSWNDASANAGDVVNEVFWTYNSFQQSIQTFQSHDGTVNTLTTANLQMMYADGSTNTIRQTGLIYPNGRTLTYDYGASGSITDACSQILSQIDSDEDEMSLADYSYLGLGVVVQQTSAQASLQYTLVRPSGNDPGTGDIYSGLDRFGRVKDCRWISTGSGSDLSRVQYGYNRASSRTWRANPTDPDQHYDWLYLKQYYKHQFLCQYFLMQHHKLHSLYLNFQKHQKLRLSCSLFLFHKPTHTQPSWVMHY